MQRTQGSLKSSHYFYMHLAVHNMAYLVEPKDTTRIHLQKQLPLGSLTGHLSPVISDNRLHDLDLPKANHFWPHLFRPDAL